MTALVQAGIPSPSVGVWYVGPVPLRAYGIIIAVGMVVALAWASRRYGRRGGDPDLLFDLALWAIPLGIVGARLYHVITSPEQYFGPGGDPWQVWQIWRGGLGIWGAVALGAVGAWIGARRAGALGSGKGHAGPPGGRIASVAHGSEPRGRDGAARAGGAVGRRAPGHRPGEDASRQSRQALGALTSAGRAFLATSTRAVKAVGSLTASSASMRRSTSTPARPRPWMNRL